MGDEPVRRIGMTDSDKRKAVVEDIPDEILQNGEGKERTWRNIRRAVEGELF